MEETCLDPCCLSTYTKKRETVLTELSEGVAKLYPEPEGVEVLDIIK